MCGPAPLSLAELTACLPLPARKLPALPLPAWPPQISPTHLRGTLGSINQLMICVGILAALLVRLQASLGSGGMGPACKVTELCVPVLRWLVSVWHAYCTVAGS